MRLTRSASVVAPALVAALGSGVSASMTRHTVGLDTDSAAYVGAAHNLLLGRGLTTPFPVFQYGPAQAASFSGAIPLTHFPPLFPLALGAVASLGPSLPTAARLLNAVLLGVNLYLAARLFVRLTSVRAWPVAIAVSSLLLVGPVLGSLAYDNWLVVHSTVLSEPLCISFLLSGLLLLDRYLTSASRRILYGAAVCGALAVLTRYVGVSLVVTASVVVGLRGAGTLRHRWRDAAIAACVGLVPGVSWAVFNRVIEHAGTPRAFDYHPGRGMAPSVLAVTEGWLMPSSWPRGVREVILFSVVVGAVVLVSTTRRVAASSFVSLGWVLCLFVGVYLAVVVIARTYFDASVPIDARILGPLQPIVYVTVLAVLWHALQPRLGTGQVLACCIGAAFFPAIAGFPAAMKLVRHPFAATQPSPILGAVERLPRRTFIVTTNPQAVFLGSRRDSISVPARIDLFTGEPNRSFAKQLQEVHLLLAAHRGVMVYLPRGFLGSYSASIEELEAAMPLRPIASFSDGGELLVLR